MALVPQYGFFTDLCLERCDAALVPGATYARPGKVDHLWVAASGLKIPVGRRYIYIDRRPKDSFLCTEQAETFPL